MPSSPFSCPVGSGDGGAIAPLGEPQRHKKLRSLSRLAFHFQVPPISLAILRLMGRPSPIPRSGIWRASAAQMGAKMRSWSPA